MMIQRNDKSTRIMTKMLSDESIKISLQQK